MKKIIAVIAAAVSIAACSKQEKKGNLEITGNIKGLHKGTLYFKKMQDTVLVNIDSVVISGDSHFDTWIDIKEPEMLYLFLDRGQTNSIDNSLLLFAEPGKMNLDTDLDTFYANAKITGSKNQELYDQYKQVKSRFVNQELDYTEKKLKAYQNKTLLDTAETEKYNNSIKRKYLYTVNFALNNKDHEVAPYVMLSEIPNVNLKYLDTVQKSLTPKIAKSLYGQILSKLITDRKKTEQQPAVVQ